VKRATSVTGGISITVNLEQLRRRWMENRRNRQNEVEWNGRREKRETKETSATGGISITANMEQLRRRFMANNRKRQNENRRNQHHS